MSHFASRLLTILTTATLLSDCSNGPIDFSTTKIDTAGTGGSAAASSMGGAPTGGRLTGAGGYTMGGTSGVATGGAPTGGQTSARTWLAISSVGGGYACPPSEPDSDTCECPELPCECSYRYKVVSNIPDNGICPTNTLCMDAWGLALTCVGGVWRVLGGYGQGSNCSECDDPSILYSTGGTTGTSTGGASSTGGAPSNGGTASNTAPIIQATGGSYACPQSEPYNGSVSPGVVRPSIPCECNEPPCECVYRYQWSGLGYCGNNPTLCKIDKDYAYICQDGAWLSTSLPGPSPSTDCDCDAGT